MIKRNKVLSGIIVAATCSNMLSNAVVMATENNNAADFMSLEIQEPNDIEDDVDIILNLENYEKQDVTTGGAVTGAETEEDSDSENMVDEDIDVELPQLSDEEEENASDENVKIINETIDGINQEIKEEITEELTDEEIILEEPELRTGGVLPTIIEEVSERVIDKIQEFNYDEIESIQTCGIGEQDNYSSTYGYSALGDLENGTKMQEAYLVILDYLNKVHNGNINIDSTLVYSEQEENYYLQKINIDEFKLDVKEYKSVFTSIRHDHPEFFWLSNGSVYSKYKGNDKEIVKYAIPLVDSQYKSRELRSKMKVKVEAAIEKYIDVINGCSSDYEIEIAIHNKIIEETIYDPNLDKDNENINNHSIVGVLVNNVAVCESYAKTMQLLLNVAGIENIYVVGHGNGGGHAWNQICIDGDYYNLDVTWDDTNKFSHDGIKYDYFNSKDEYFNAKYYDAKEDKFKPKHIANKPDCSTGTGEYLYPVKECTSDDASYYSKSDITLKLSDLQGYENEEDAIKKYFTDMIKGYLNEEIYEFRFAGQTNELTTKMYQYFRENIRGIIIGDSELKNIYIQKCGTSISYSISEVQSGEREIRVNFKPLNKVTADNITMTKTLTFDTLKYSAYLIPEFNPINSYNKDSIVWESSDTNVATVVKGTVTPMGEGTAKITASIDGITAECTVTVKLDEQKELQGEIPVTGVTIIPGSTTIYGVGSTQQFKAEFEPYNATNTNVTWGSDDESIISIDKNGLATANGIGSTYIYCIPDETTMTSHRKYRVTVEQAKPADKSRLQSLYNEHKDKEQGSYTEESFNSFKEALNKSAQVLDDSTASQELVDNTCLELEKAVAELKEKDKSKKIGYGKFDVTNQSRKEMETAKSKAMSGLKITEETTVDDIFNAYAAVLGSDVKIEITNFANDPSTHRFDYDFRCSNSNGSLYFVTGGGYASESSRISAISIPIYDAIYRKGEFTEETTKEDIEAIIREIVKKEGFNFEVEFFENKDGIIRLTYRVDSKNLSKKWNIVKNHRVKLQNYTGMGQADVTNQALDTDCVDEVLNLLRDMEKNEKTTAEDVYNVAAKLLGTDVTIEISDFYNGSDYDNNNGGYKWDFDIIFSNSVNKKYIVMGGGYRPTSEKLDSLKNTINTTMYWDDNFNYATTEAQVRVLLDNLVKEKGYDYEILSFENNNKEMKLSYSISYIGISVSSDFSKTHKDVPESKPELPGDNDDNYVGSTIEKLNSLREEINIKLTFDDCFNPSTTEAQVRVFFDNESKDKGYDYEIISFENSSAEMKVHYSLSFNGVSVSMHLIRVHKEIPEYKPEEKPDFSGDNDDNNNIEMIFERLNLIVGNINSIFTFDDYFNSATTEAQVMVLLDNEVRDNGYDYEIISFENNDKEMKLSYIVSFNGISVSSDFIKIHKEVPEYKPEEKPDFPADDEESSGAGSGDNEKPGDSNGDSDSDGDEIQNPVVKEKLKNLYDEYNDISMGRYTTATWSVFKEAMKDAESVLNSANMTQEEVDEMYESLKAAYNGLKKKGSSSSSSSGSSGSSSSSSSEKNETGSNESGNNSESLNDTNTSEDKGTINNQNQQNTSGLINNNADPVKSISESIGAEVISKEKVVTENGNTVEVTKVLINNKSANIVKADNTDIVSVEASENDKVYVFVEGLGGYKEIDSQLVEGNAVFNAESGMSYIVSDSTVISNEVSDGWNKVNDSWYVVNKNGALITGWYKDNDKWYNLSSDGKMNTGWIKDNDGKWYMLNESGAMKTGWHNDKGTWYHLSESGSMSTGWIKDSNEKWYYLNNDGSMASNQYIDGYWLNGNGEWVI